MESKSEFNSLCKSVVSTFKEKYTHIKRIYIQAEYKYINDDYEKHLLKSCEETYYPKRTINVLD